MRIDPTVTRLSNGGWRFSWTATTGPYEIYLDGDLLDSITTTSFDVNRPGYETAPPDVEIIDGASGSISDSEQYPPYMILQWRGLSNAIGYVIEKFVDTATGWVVQNTVRENKLGYYKWKSETLNDEETYQYRVRAVDLQGNKGVAVSFTFEMVRNPAHPNVDITVNSSGNIQVAAS